MHYKFYLRKVFLELRTCVTVTELIELDKCPIRECPDILLGAMRADSAVGYASRLAVEEAPVCGNPCEIQCGRSIFQNSCPYFMEN